MTAIDFITPSDLQAAQAGSMRSSIIDRIIDWLSDHIGGTNRLAVVECFNGMFSDSAEVRNKSCDELRDLLGYKAAHLFTHGVDENGQFFTEFQPNIYGCDPIRILRGQAGDKAEYVISRGFVDQEPQSAILDAYFPVHNSARLAASKAISTMMDRYATDFAKRDAFTDLHEIASQELKGRMSRTPAGSISANFGLMPLAENFKLDRCKMDIDREAMVELLNAGVAKDIEEMEPLHQLAADLPRDAYYFDTVPVNAGSNPTNAAKNLVRALKFNGASDAQIDALTTVATQRMYGMILGALSWTRNGEHVAMIPSTSSHGGMSRFDIFFNAIDMTITVHHSRKQDICAGLGGLISDYDVENHFEAMQEEFSASVKSTETEFNLRILPNGSIDVIGTPIYAYNPEVPK